MNCATARTDRAGNIALKFHLPQRTFKIGHRNGADYGVTFVANNVRLISATDAEQTAATINIAEIRVRNDRSALMFCVHWFIIAAAIQ